MSAVLEIKADSKMTVFKFMAVERTVKDFLHIKASAA